MITCILYFDLRTIKIVCYSVLTINVVRVIWMVAIQGQYSKSLTTDYTIQLIALFIIGAELIKGTKIAIKNNEEKMTSIEEMAIKEKQIASEIINIAGLLDKNCNRVFEHIDQLAQKSNMLDEKSKLVNDAIQALTLHMQQIQGITETISSIAAETNILSLNAAIESARAGEVGKGFAVVAAQVRTLADDTKQSANEIAKIIFALQDSMIQCTNAMGDFTMINNEQSNLISSTHEIFTKTHEVAHHTKESANLLMENINKVFDANTEIIDSISEISALSQETMASVEETTHTTQANMVEIEDTKQLTKELLDTSLRMGEYL